jgi:hypothetical protein
VIDTVPDAFLASLSQMPLRKHGSRRASRRRRAGWRTRGSATLLRAPLSSSWTSSWFSSGHPGQPIAHPPLRRAARAPAQNPSRPPGSPWHERPTTPAIFETWVARLANPRGQRRERTSHSPMREPADQPPRHRDEPSEKSRERARAEDGRCIIDRIANGSGAQPRQPQAKCIALGTPVPGLALAAAES